MIPLWIAKIEGWLITAGLAICLVLALYFYVHSLQEHVKSADARADKAEAAATVASHQTAAGQTAAGIIDTGAQRALTTTNLQAKHATAITAAGDSPALNDVGRRGLCEYEAYAADPSCVELRKAHP